MSDIVTYDGSKALTPQEVQEHVNLIQKVMDGVMKDGEHYGKIPGCGNKKTLLKPGAEKLLSTFRIAVNPKVEDLSGEDEIRYRVSCELTAQESGMFLGAGVGECSSSEDKYKWKKATCDAEWEDTIPHKRREKWFKGWNNNPAYQVKQIRTEPADVANTVLKMAKKRAMIDATLTVTAASDIFVQDITDVDIPDSGEVGSPPPMSEPQAKGGDALPKDGPPPPDKQGDITGPMVKKLQAMLGGLGIKDDYERHMKVSTVLGFSAVLDSFNNLSKDNADTCFKAFEAEMKASK